MSKSSKRKRPPGSTCAQTSTTAGRAPRPVRKSTADQGPLARYRSAILAAAAGVGVLIFAFVFLQSAGKLYACDSLLAPPAQASADPIALGFETQDLGQAHVMPAGTKITYAFCPPTSGGHWNSADRGPIRNAVYGAASEQAPGGWVHNLEHGAIVVLYRCPSGTLGSGDCATAEDLALMQQWFDSAPAINNCAKQAVAARFDEMSTPFAVLAWNRALLFDRFDLALASAFAQQWTDVIAPEAPRC